MESVWQRPITNKKYLQAPMSEMFYTIWPECKLIFGDVEPANEQESLYWSYDSSGIWFVRGGINGELDFHNAEFVVREDGVPIHTLKNNAGGLEYSIEAFSEYKRRGRCFFRLTVTNKMKYSYTENIGFMLKTGREATLIKDAPNHYKPYSPEISRWYSIPSTWRMENGYFRDGERYIAHTSDRKFNYVDKHCLALAEITLAPEESWSISFAYGEGEVQSFDYEAEKEKATAAWLGELERIKNIPEALIKDGVDLSMIKHLVSTLLQHFCCPKGEDYTILRQGGLQRMIWPFEAMPALEALDRLGDFDDYIEPVIDMYFRKCQVEDGEIVPFGVHWAICTATALTSFSKYAMTRERAFFDKYRDRAYKAFKWIQGMRVKEAKEGVVRGLFPPFRSNDDDLVFQNYGFTDTYNLGGIRSVLEVFEYFSDPLAEEMRAECKDYEKTLLAVWKNIAGRAEGDELRVPFIPVGDDSEVAKKYGFSHTGSYCAYFLDIPIEDAEKIINYYTRTGLMKDGLYDKLPDKLAPGVFPQYLDENGRCVVWYLTISEHLWLEYFLRHGMREKAKETLDACARYAMSKDYYMVERFNEQNPYFAPWMPNASANGRFILMLLDYYGS